MRAFRSLSLAVVATMLVVLPQTARTDHVKETLDLLVKPLEDGCPGTTLGGNIFDAGQVDFTHVSSGFPFYFHSVVIELFLGPTLPSTTFRIDVGRAPVGACSYEFLGTITTNALGYAHWKGEASADNIQQAVYFLRLVPIWPIYGTITVGRYQTDTTDPI